MSTTVLSRFAGAAFVAVAIACGIAASQTPQSVLRIQDLLDMTNISGGPVISPDGTRVAYTASVGTADTGSGSIIGNGHDELWVMDLTTSDRQRVGDPKADTWAPVWSPDGRHLAFFSNHGQSSKLGIWDVRTERSRIADLAVDTRGPFVAMGTESAQWLPDSRRLVIRTATAQSQREEESDVAITASPLPTPVIAVFDSTPAAVPAQSPTAATAEPNAITQSIFGINDLDEVIYDSLSGSSRVVLPTTHGIVARLSPDGKKLMYLVDEGNLNGDPDRREVMDIAVIDLASGVSTALAKGALSYAGATGFVWSHDSTKIAFGGGSIPNDAGSERDGHLYVVDIRRPGELRPLSTLPVSREDGPMWSLDDTTLYALDPNDLKTLDAISVATGAVQPVLTIPDARLLLQITSNGLFLPALYRTGSHVYLSAHSDAGQDRMYDADLATGQTRLLYSETGGTHLYFQAAEDNTNIVSWLKDDYRSPQDVWVTQNAFASVRQLTHLNPQIEARAFGRPESVKWTSRTGTPIEGVLILPAGYVAGQRYPTIVFLYGGASYDVNQLSFDEQGVTYLNPQLFASRGYAVFMASTPLRMGTPMKDIADDVLPGIDTIVSMGVADPNRLGVYGHSFGGYATLSLVVQSNRFKAAIAMAGASSMFAMYGAMNDDGSDEWTSWAETGQGRIGGTPWEYRQRYIDNSPYFFIDQVQTPILLEYGTLDSNATGINQGALFIGLRRLGKTAELVRYAGENHGINTRAHEIDWWNRMNAWFEKYLQ